MKHVLGFSGGVDSQMAALWLRRKFTAEDIILLNSQAGRNEHALTVEFVANYSRTVHPVIEVVPLVKDWTRRILKGANGDTLNRGTKEGATRNRLQEFDLDAEMTFDRLAYLAGRWPSTTAQFCTEHLKLVPTLRWIEENLQPGTFEMYSGVRCDESDKRKDTPDREYSEEFCCWMNYPIRCWTKMECFAVLKHAGEETNPLYKMGFSRVGCAPCINSKKEEILQWSIRAPEVIDKIRAWEKYTGRTFFSPRVPGMEMNFIDDVVAWANTARGGKQPLLMFADQDAHACSSKYGLCE